MTQIEVMRKIARQGDCVGIMCTHDNCPWNYTNHEAIMLARDTMGKAHYDRECFNVAANAWLDKHDPDQLLFHIELEERP